MKFINILLLILLIVAFGLGRYNSERNKEIITGLLEIVEQRNEQLIQYQEAYSVLEGYYNQLGSDYNQLTEYTKQLSGDYEQLTESNNKLKQDYAQSQQEAINLGQQVTSLEKLEEQLREEIATNEENYKGQIEMAREEAEEAVFTFYYVPMEQRYGVNDLKSYLKRGEWKEGAYIEGEFDCSQMSAYLEWKLENEGYHTVIVGGKSPDGSGRHAWLLVETTKGKYMPVEATAYSIVYWSYPHFDNYFEYEFEFETIHEALVYSPTEFNWWD